MPARTFRAVSTLEVVIALSVFLVVALGLASASVRLAAQGARNEARLATVDAIDTRLELLSGAPFDELIAGTFTAPDACGERGTVDGRTSCVRVAGRSLRITYTVSVGNDPVAGAGASAAYVDLTALAELPDDSTVSRDLRVPSPSVGWTADGAVVRVRSADGSDDVPPITVLDSHGAVVAEGVPFLAGSAVIRVSGSACWGANAPCRVALSTDPAAWWTSGGWTLSPSSITGSAANLELAPGTLTETSIDVSHSSTARIRVLAQPTGKAPVGGAPEGTVCVWAAFNDGSSARNIPYCNTGTGSEGGAYIPVNGWPSADGARTYPFPEDFELAISADHPDGFCAPAPLWRVGSAKGATTGNAFVNADVCTTWTWGHPTLGGRTGDSPEVLASNRLTVRTGTASPSYDLIWAARNAAGEPVALPAAGDGATPAWAKPRSAANAGACATDSNPATRCNRPAVTPAPELAPGAPPACLTNPFCLSVWNQAPQLTNPAAPRTIPVPDLAENLFTLSVADADSPSVELAVTVLPTQGALTTRTGVAYTAGTWLPAAAAYDMRYVRGGAFDGLDTMTVSLRDSSGLTSTYEIGLYDPAQPWTLTGPSSISIAQNQTNVAVKVRVASTTGANTVGLTPTAGGTDLVVTAPSATDAEGYSTFNLSVGAVAAGPRVLLVGAGERSIAIPVTITATPAAVNVATITGGAQGGAGSVTVHATDVTGAALAGGTIELSATYGGAATGRVRPEVARCVADLSGNCTSPIRIDTGAPAGVYTIAAKAGAVSVTGQLTVTQVPATLTAAGGRVVGDQFTASTTAAGPYRWLRLDERSGTSAAAAVGTPGGAYSGTPALGAPSLVGGGESSAVRFDGLDDRMCTPTVDLTGDASLEVWARFEGFTTNPTTPAQIWGRAADGSGGLALVLGGGTGSSADTLRLVAQVNGQPISVAAPSGMLPGRTYHLVGTFDGSALRLYIDGAPVAALPYPGTLAADGNWCAASSGSSAAHVAATLDEASIYDFALSGSQVVSRATLGRVTGAGTGWVSVNQGGTAEIPVKVLDGAGDPVPGRTVTLSVTGSRLTVPASTVTTNSAGDATLTIAAKSTAPSGTALDEKVLVSAAGASVALTVDVAAVPATITASNITVAAGGRNTWPVMVRDAAGAPMAGAAVNAVVVGGTGGGLRLGQSSVTDGAGIASPTLGAQASDVGSTHTVRFSAGNAFAQATVTVSASSTKVETVGGPFRIDQGSAGTWKLRVTDTDGGALADVPVAVSCNGCGLGFGAAANTASDGTTTVEVIDLAGANPQGSYNVVISVGGQLRAARVGVRGVPTAVAGPETVGVRSGKQSSFTATVTDLAGAPLSGVTVTGSGPAGITIDGSRSGGKGQATVTVRASGSVGAGTYSITLDGGGATGTISIEVTP